MNVSRLFLCSSALVLAGASCVGALSVAPSLVHADAPASSVTSINASYQGYFDSIREDTLTYWTPFTSAVVRASNYNYLTCSFDVLISLPYHWSMDYGAYYMFRLCTDDSNVLGLYWKTYPVGSYTKWSYDFALQWEYSSVSSSDGDLYDVFCYVNRSPSAWNNYGGDSYLHVTATGASTPSYVYPSYFSSGESALLYSLSSLTDHPSFISGLTLEGRWSAPYDDAVDEQVSAAYGNGYDEGYSDGYSDGASAGSSDGYANGYSDGYSDGASAGSSDGYANGYSDGYLDGGSAGYHDGYDDGKSAGFDTGYDAGNSVGYSSGYVVGYDHGLADGGTTMVDIWSVMSAVITMPFTFFQNGFDFTLFESTPYAFPVGAFLGSVLVLLMIWKILGMIIKFVI